MNPLLVFILTKTGIIRWLGNFLAASLVSYGVVKGGEEAQIAGATVAIVTGLITMLIEQKKASEVKKMQALLDAVTPAHIKVKTDGLAGPQTRAAVVAIHNMQGGKG